MSFKIGSNKSYEIEDGRVKNYYITLELNTNRGLFYSRSKNENLSVGDSVLINEKYAAGWLLLICKNDKLKGFNITNGKVSSIEEKSFSTAILSIFIVTIALMVYLSTLLTKIKMQTYLQ